MLLEFPEGRFVLHLENKVCFYVGVTGSGFPFDLGRIPYKGKRPLKDMIGSYRNRHVSSEPSAEGVQSSSSKSASEVQLQVQSQQEELEQLKKDLSSQKVTIPPRLCVPCQPLGAPECPDPQRRIP